MSKWLARIVLVLIFAGFLTGMGFIHIYVRGSVWPFWSGNHTTVLLVSVACFVWVILSAAIIYVLAYIIYGLCKRAFE